jgi:hypothetical protein
MRQRGGKDFTMRNKVIKCTIFFLLQSLVKCVILQSEEVWYSIMYGNPLISYLMFFQEGAAEETYSELELHLFPALQTSFLLLIILVLHFQKMFRVHSALYLQVVIFQSRILWETVF